MPFPEDPLDSITLPSGGDVPDTFIYFGDEDKYLHTWVDKGIYYHYGPNGSAIVTGIDGNLGGDPHHARYTIKSVIDVPGVGLGDQLQAIEINVNDSGFGGPCYILFGDSAFPTYINGTTVEVLNILKVNDVDVGRGLFYSARRTSVSGNCTTADTALWTLATKTFPANRAYEIRSRIVGGASTANAFLFPKIKQPSGNTIVEFGRTTCSLSGVVYNLGGGSDLFVTGGNDVTTALTVTLAASTGTGNLYGAGGGAANSGSASCAIAVYDVGDAASYLANDPAIPVIS